MKRLAVIGMALLILLTGCASEMVSGVGTIETPDAAAEIVASESPDADESLPIESETESAAVSAASEPASSSSSSEAAPPASSTPASSTPAPAVSESSSAAPQSSSEASQSSASESSKSTSSTTTATTTVSGEVRAVWISYLEFLEIAQNRSKSQFTSSITEMFETVADYGLNTVYVQVRPFGDALYDSDYFPWSYVLTGEEGVNPGYDPLAIMVRCAQNEGLRIEAWINPYRVRATGSTRTLSSGNPAARAISSGSSLAISYSGGVFYNPASAEARQLITDGVVEILEKYDVDGIHFDDYFYPTTDTSFDATDYAAYTSSGGKLSLADWRRQNVTKLIRQVSAAIQETKPSATFGISPQARTEINYNQQYADVAAWCSEGLLDYVCPQIYFGFDHATVPFDDCADTWSDIVSGTKTDLYIGLAAYKCGVTDSYAGAGANEWVTSNDMLKQMVCYARTLSGYGGFVVYRYDSLFNPASSVKSALRAERSNLASIL